MFLVFLVTRASKMTNLKENNLFSREEVLCETLLFVFLQPLELRKTKELTALDSSAFNKSCQCCFLGIRSGFAILQVFQ